MSDGSKKNLKEQEYGLPIPPQEEPYATVGVKAGATVNQGDFNSARIDVSLFYPCKAEPEQVDKTYEKVRDWVDKRMAKEYESLIKSQG